MITNKTNVETLIRKLSLKSQNIEYLKYVATQFKLKTRSKYLTKNGN